MVLTMRVELDYELPVALATATEGEGHSRGAKSWVRGTASAG